MVFPAEVARRLTSSRSAGSPSAARATLADSVASIAWRISLPGVPGPASARFVEECRARAGRRCLVLAAIPDPQQRSPESPCHRGPGLLELLPRVGQPRPGCPDLRQPLGVISRQVRPYTVAWRGQPPPCPNRRSDDFSGSWRRVNGGGVPQELPDCLVPVVAGGGSPPRLVRPGQPGRTWQRRMPTAPAGSGRTAKSNTASVPPDSPSTVTVSTSGSNWRSWCSRRAASRPAARACSPSRLLPRRRADVDDEAAGCSHPRQRRLQVLVVVE